MPPVIIGSTPAVTRHDNGNIEIKLILPWPQINEVFTKLFTQALAEVEIPGFRKGTAPKEMAEPKIDKSQLYGQAVQQLLPQTYDQAIATLKLTPLLYPRLKIIKGELNSDWEFLATTCEAPQVSIPSDYETALKTIPTDPPDTRLGRQIEKLRELAPIKIPDILVEEEANHRLAGLVDNLTKLGLTTESYLQTKKLTPETLKSQLAAEARTDLEVEFLLRALGEMRKLTDRQQLLSYLQSLV